MLFICNVKPVFKSREADELCTDCTLKVRLQIFKKSFAILDLYAYGAYSHI